MILALGSTLLCVSVDEYAGMAFILTTSRFKICYGTEVFWDNFAQT